MKECCAVVGIYAPGKDVAVLTYFALYALQHRGQESSGIAVSNGKNIECYKEMGLVSQVFTQEILQRLKGHIAIGHNRYSTSGTSKIHNAQPVILKTHLGTIALAHNGNLINYEHLKKMLLERGLTFATSSDSEVIAKLFALSEADTLEEKISSIMGELRGAYSITMCTPNELIGFRDPLGIRPLCIGKINGGWVISSESCALNTIGAEFIKEIPPGEGVIISQDGLKSFAGRKLKQESLCIFEYIYFARPDSLLNNRSIYSARYNMGRKLAKEWPVEADAVMAIPDSAVPAAMGFSYESGLTYIEGLIKNRYIARTFIQPEDHLRKLGIKLKFNLVVENIKNKKLVVIDDSIVRGNTTKAIVKLLKEAGAKEVHIRITSPPMQHPCFLGVDTATYGELIAANKNISEIADFIGADSLGYLSLEGLMEATGYNREKFCAACFNGEYPLLFDEKIE
ncbi:MAG: amidophosphoribosyltransferase [Armatimonadetes bacterium]|nr:amidophosphoribosyltransferase [Armatimonadota bacterium]